MQRPLKLLGRLRKEGDGDTGVAFEYAVHDAIARGEAAVLERIEDAMRLCRIGGDPTSILFAIEKAGAKQLISTQIDMITDESRVLSGNVGQPAKLKRYLNTLDHQPLGGRGQATTEQEAGIVGRATVGV